MNTDLSLTPVVPGNAGRRLPMHPEDYAALLAWVRAKNGWADKNTEP